MINYNDKFITSDSEYTDLMMPKQAKRVVINNYSFRIGEQMVSKTISYDIQKGKLNYGIKVSIYNKIKYKPSFLAMRAKCHIICLYNT